MRGDLEIGTEASPATKACTLGSISDPPLFDSDYCVPHRPEAPELVAEARVKAVGTGALRTRLWFAGVDGYMLQHPL
ncbi:hypothetical protein SESBI_05219 [Sesbania bispinosa]|nr:hypothetical protein SESBI_05219 [Sesbania bispinosa]